MGRGNSVGLVADGRLSRAIGLVRDGDAITIDVEARALTMGVDDAELARRRAAWKPRPMNVKSKWLRRYAAHVTNASNGAVLEIE